MVRAAAERLEGGGVRCWGVEAVEQMPLKPDTATHSRSAAASGVGDSHTTNFVELSTTKGLMSSKDAKHNVWLAPMKLRYNHARRIAGFLNGLKVYKFGVALLARMKAVA